jgi:hypothetical protein
MSYRLRQGGGTLEPAVRHGVDRPAHLRRRTGQEGRLLYTRGTPRTTVRLFQVFFSKIFILFYFNRQFVGCVANIKFITPLEEGNFLFSFFTFCHMLPGFHC